MRNRCETELQDCVRDVFRRCPSLCGFAVKVGAIELDDLTWYPQPEREVAEAVREEISELLLELVDEQPEAALLLSGRTFARRAH